MKKPQKALRFILLYMFKQNKYCFKNETIYSFYTLVRKAKCYNNTLKHTNLDINHRPFGDNVNLVSKYINYKRRANLSCPTCTCSNWEH